MPRTFSCVVPVTVTLVEDIPGKALPFTRSALKALAHAMVFDAMKFTEAERGFFAAGTDYAAGEISAAWLMPKGYDSLDAMTIRVAKGRRRCTTTKRACGSTATG
jgi:hypothetical protein